MVNAATAIKQEEGPELLTMPADKDIGIYPQFIHPDKPFPGWLRDRIVVFKQDGPSGGKPVYVQVNGFNIGIPREIEVDIPRPFVDALRNAVEEKWERDEVTGVEGPRKIRRYNWELKQEAVNFDELKRALEKYIDRENKRIKKEWQIANANKGKGNGVNAGTP